MQYVMFLMNKIINCFFNHVLANSYSRNECEKTFFAHEPIICGTSDEGASASFARMCRIRLLASKLVQYFLKRTLRLICRILFVNKMALVHAVVKVSNY
jgi:hypothetical protein